MSSRILYTFKCNDCKDVQDMLEYSNVQTLPCECGGEYHRQISAPRIALDGTDPGFPDAYNKWATQHEQGGRGQG